MRVRALQNFGDRRQFTSSNLYLYISIKENLLIPGSGFPRTPPKPEGLGE